MDGLTIKTQRKPKGAARASRPMPPSPEALLVHPGHQARALEVRACIRHAPLETLAGGRKKNEPPYDFPLKWREMWRGNTWIVNGFHETAWKWHDMYWLEMAGLVVKHMFMETGRNEWQEIGPNTDQNAGLPVESSVASSPPVERAIGQKQPRVVFRSTRTRG